MLESRFFEDNKTKRTLLVVETLLILWQVFTLFLAKCSCASWTFNDVTIRFLALMPSVLSTTICARYALYLECTFDISAKLPNTLSVYLTELVSSLYAHILRFLPVCTVHFKTGWSLNFCADDLQKLSTIGKLCTSHQGRVPFFHNKFQVHCLTHLTKEQTGFWSCEHWWADSSTIGSKWHHVASSGQLS